MNSLQNQIELNKLNNTSSNIPSNDHIINNIDEKIDKIEKILEENKKKRKNDSFVCNYISTFL